MAGRGLQTTAVQRLCVYIYIYIYTTLHVVIFAVSAVTIRTLVSVWLRTDEKVQL